MSLRHAVMTQHRLSQITDTSVLDQEVAREWLEVEKLKDNISHHEHGVAMVLAHVALTKKWGLLHLLNNYKKTITLDISSVMKIKGDDLSHYFYRAIGDIYGGKSVIPDDPGWITIERRIFSFNMVGFILHQLFYGYSPEQQKRLTHPDGHPLEVCTSEEFHYNISLHIPHKISTDTKALRLDIISDNVPGACDLVHLDKIPLGEITEGNMVKIRDIAISMLRGDKVTDAPHYMVTNLFCLAGAFPKEEHQQLLYDVGYRVKLNEDDSYTVTCPTDIKNIKVSEESDYYDWCYLGVAMRIEALQIANGEYL